MRWAARVLTGGLAALLLVVGLFLLTARFTPVSFGFIATPLTSLIQTRLNMQDVTVTRPVLYWAHNEAIFGLKIDGLSLVGRDNDEIQLSDVTIVPSGRALREQWQLLPAIIEVRHLHIAPKTDADTSPAIAGLLPGEGTGGDASIIDYLQSLTVRSISIGQTKNTDDQQSHILLTRDTHALRLAATLTYSEGKMASRVDAVGYFKEDWGGHIDIALDNINPRDIGRFSQLLAPLQGVRLPITAQIALNISSDGRPLNGQANLYVAPGDVVLAEQILPIEELTLGVQADFAARRLDLNDVRFSIGGVAGNLTGQIDYTQNAAGRLARMDVGLNGLGVSVNLPKIFGQKVNIARLDTQLSYDIGTSAITFDRFSALHNFGRAELTGVVTVSDTNPKFDLNIGFGEMSRAAVEALWPLPIAPKTRAWAKQNLIGGVLRDGRLTLNVDLDEMVNREPGTPMREDALRFDLNFSDIGVRYLRDAPPIENTNAKLSLRGKSFSVETQGGRVRVPAAEQGVSTLNLENGFFGTDDFRNPKSDFDIRFAAFGPIKDAMRTLRAPPFNQLRDIDFDFDRIQGDARAQVALKLPIFVKPAQRKITYQVKADAADVAIDDKLGPFEINKGQVLVEIDNQGMRMNGTAAVNGVETDIDWRQPFGDKAADKSRLLVSGVFSPQDVADLGQAWIGQRFDGLVDTSVQIDGPLNQPRQFKVNADLLAARFMPRPLAYEKPQGQPAKIEALIRNDDDGDMAAIDGTMSLPEAGRTDFNLTFDKQVLTGLKITPLSLGRDENLRISISQDAGSVFASVKADAFDVAELLGTANKDIEFEPEPFSFLKFLGPEAIMEAQFERLLGAHEEEMQGVRMRLIRQNGLHEKLTFDGVFKDGTSVIAGLDRETDKTRSFAVQAENTGNVLRLLDLQKEVFGGSLVMQGTLYDTQRDIENRERNMDGRLTMVGFRARNVPVLASLFSLASLSGIADTLSGEGIKFRKLQSNFVVNNGKLTIDDGRMHGPAVGLTMQGDYDFSRGDIDVGGTLVPAYSINSFFGKIPLVGRILASREGEGLVGIGYRISGTDGKASALVNPLSVLTPGVFRRIFELGIGLPDNIDDLIPDLPQEELTE